MTDPTLVKLRELLLNEFTEPELAALSADLGLNYQSLPGTGAFGKTRAMVEAARSQDKLRALQSRLRELRPDAYAAAGIAALSADAADSVSTSSGRTSALPAGAAPARQDTSAFPFQILAVILVLLLCGVVGLAVLLPRLNASVAPSSVSTAAETAGTAGTAGLALEPTVQAVSPTQPTELATNTGGVLAPLETINPANTPPAAATAEIPLSQQVTASLTATIVAAPTVLPDTVLTQTQPAQAPAISPASAVTDSSPIVLAIRDLNEQLLAFYRGQATAQDLQQHWSGDALRSVIGFGSTRLPRAMRIQPAQRDSLSVSYGYQRTPVIASANATGAVVTSRETWRYANALNETEVCELREYVYNLVKDGESWKVRQFRSNLLESGCAPQ